MNAVRTPLFYMANLGSEISRALLEYQREDFGKMRHSIIRARGIIGKIEEFRLDSLVNMAHRLGLTVSVKIAA